jgi:hypothetical protein
MIEAGSIRGNGELMVYFVQGTITGLIKVGTTRLNIQKRISMIQSSDPLIVLRTMDGDKSTERAIQDRFKSSWSHGEWFNPSQDLLDYINTIPLNEHVGLRHSSASPWDRLRGNKGKPGRRLSQCGHVQQSGTCSECVRPNGNRVKSRDEDFHVVLGNLAKQVAQEEPTISPVFTRVLPSEEFFLDDETKLRYQTHQQSI